ncbi:unnamed protein product [Chilo suppressalis]|uniref:Calcineurin-like phosphoesterase domain-containing protein n=1 Tax=Chilo suppressalis TaxID=168631 RepID=A0ABN8B8M7_CHISP|nr:unnamed protein product [Chilo suppressalis]
MRRVTKKLLIFLLGVLFTFFYCEYLIYYVVVYQCAWPLVNTTNDNLKALIIADTHLLSPRKGHWLDKWRREFQMQQAFTAIITAHNPDVVFVLGDLFDEGEWSNERQFEAYAARFFNLFSVPSNTSMYVVAGNHDIGFHNFIRRNSAERFVKLLHAPAVQFLTLKGNNFVLINSMAMEGDNCELCTEARSYIDDIPKKLNTSNVESNVSQPILMQHFPLYRVSDAACTEPDAPPLPERNKPFRSRIDALSKESTLYLVSKIKPRAVFGGHTHHGCLIHHSYEDLKSNFFEYSVPSFSWRNRSDPKYMLVTIAPFVYAVNKCGLPQEPTIILTAIVLIFILIYFLMRRKSIGRGY